MQASVALEIMGQGAVVIEAEQPLDVRLQKAAAWEWSCRHVFELDAHARFNRLSDTLRRHHAPTEIVALTEQAARDEKRHAFLCQDLVAYCGGRISQQREVHAPPIYPEKLSSKSQLLYELVAMSCVTETLSCTLLGIMVEQTEDQFLKQAMRSILRDEVGHSRLGWAYLADQSRFGPQSFISDYLPNMLASTVHDEIFKPQTQSPYDAVLGHLGVLSRARRLDIFTQTMTSVVFPGFEKFGIDTDTGRTWLEQQKNRCSPASTAES